MQRKGRLTRRSEGSPTAPAAWAVVALALLAGCGAGAFLHTRQEKLDDDVRVYLGGGGNSLAFAHGRGDDALLVDPKMAPYTRRTKWALERELAREVRRILLTHAHGDHAAGLTEYPAIGAVLAHPNTIRHLLGPEGPCSAPTSPSRTVRSTWQGQSAPTPGDALQRVHERPLCAMPFVEVTSEVRLWLGAEEVQVKYLGVGHTDGDLVAWFPERKLLVAGDLVLNGWQPRVDPAMGGDVLALGRTLDKLLELSFETVVPGHGEVCGREEVEQARAYLRTLEEDVRRARAQGLDEETTVTAVPLPSVYADLPPVPFADSHENKVRLMYRALAEEGM